MDAMEAKVRDFVETAIKHSAVLTQPPPDLQMWRVFGKEEEQRAPVVALPASQQRDEL